MRLRGGAFSQTLNVCIVGLVEYNNPSGIHVSLVGKNHQMEVKYHGALRSKMVKR
jgi:hypothetical protein